MQKMLYLALQAAIEAGKSIKVHYNNKTEPDLKRDGTPITQADRSANSIILKYLKETSLPVISEESPMPEYYQRSKYEWYWLVDPLDGTKEYIMGNGEFTVNIALINRNTPKMGVILAPVLNTAYFGIVGSGSWKIADINNFEKDNPEWQKSSPATFAIPLDTIPLPEVTSVSVSRSHPDEKTSELITKLKSGNRHVKIAHKGSSLKFCDLSEKSATIYPRYSPTYEWDTAAGHAILKASGGEVYSLKGKDPLTYNKPDLLNPPFIALASTDDSQRYFSELSL